MFLSIFKLFLLHICVFDIPDLLLGEYPSAFKIACQKLNVVIHCLQVIMPN
jgi:hypothetical protein